MDTLIIRADASATIGHGHVMRCLALAQSWQDRGGRCIFASAHPIAALETRLKSEGFESVKLNAVSGSREDAEKLVECAAQNDTRWVVIDGYHFAIEYQRIVKTAGVKLLVVDDYGQIGSYAADVILDQNTGTAENFYHQRGADTELLLGTRYAMLRREFREWRGWKREVPPVARKLLVTMGGSDPENLTAQVIEAFGRLRLPELDVKIVVGGGNPHKAELSQVAATMDNIRIEVDARNMPELMADADVAISSASSTCWELCMLGLPAIVVDAARNQLPLAQALNSIEAAVHIPRAEFRIERITQEIQSITAAVDQRDKLSANASRLIDGRGAARVVSAMQSGAITIRPVDAQDCNLLWQWASDSSVRSSSFSPETISWQQHQAWFQSKINNPRSFILIAEDERRRPVGQCRADLNAGRDAEIDISISREYRGVGYGPRLIRMCVREVFKRTEAERLHAFIRPENRASVRAFSEAQFTYLGLEIVKGTEAFHYVREKSPLTSEGAKADVIESGRNGTAGAAHSRESCFAAS